MGSSKAVKSNFSNSLRAHKWLVATLLFVAVVYVSTLSVNHSEAEDSPYYVTFVSHGSLSDQFHPNHLFFGILNHLVLRVVRLLGYEGNAELPMKVLNVLASLVALTVLFVITTRLGMALPLKLCCLFAVAFSYGYWWYSVECEAYILPIPFLLLSLHRLLLIQDDFSHGANHATLGVLHAVAILLHKQHILFGIIVVFGYILIFYPKRREITLLQFSSRIFLYGGTSIVTVVLSYVLVATLIMSFSSSAEILDWFLSHAGSEYWGKWTASALWQAWIGLSRVFIGGHFAFSFSAFSNLLQSMLPGFLLREEIFLVRDFSMLKSVSLVVLSLFVFSLVAFLIVRMGKHHAVRAAWSYGPHPERIRLIVIMCAAYIVVYSLFNIWWEPQNLEFWISFVPILILMLTTLMLPIVVERKVQISLGMIVVCAFLINLFGSVLPQTDHEHDYWYTFNSWLIANCRADDVVVSGAGFISDGYLMLYTNATVVTTSMDVENIERRFRDSISQSKPGRIFFSSTICAPPEELRRRFHLDTSIAAEFFERSRRFLTLVHSDSWQDIYLYNPVPE